MTSNQVKFAAKIYCLNTKRHLIRGIDKYSDDCYYEQVLSETDTRHRETSQCQRCQKKLELEVIPSEKMKLAERMKASLGLLWYGLGAAILIFFLYEVLSSAIQYRAVWGGLLVSAILFWMGWILVKRTSAYIKKNYLVDRVIHAHSLIKVNIVDEEGGSETDGIPYQHAVNPADPNADKTIPVRPIFQLPKFIGEVTLACRERTGTASYRDTFVPVKLEIGGLIARRLEKRACPNCKKMVLFAIDDSGIHIAGKPDEQHTIRAKQA